MTDWRILKTTYIGHFFMYIVTDTWKQLRMHALVWQSQSRGNCVWSLLPRIKTDSAALISYGRQFHISGAAQRKAHDPIFVRDEHGSSCLSSADDLRAR